MDKFQFNPPTGFKDGNSYPNPANATQTREQLQSLHDQTKDFVNGMIDTLNGEEGYKEIGTPNGTLDEVMLTSEDIKQVRVNQDGVLEYSTNGKDFYPSSSSGHVILNEYGDRFAQRTRLKFNNTVVSDDPENDCTVISGIKGETGATGPAGPGVPTGGTTNYVLVKSSDLSYETEWSDGKNTPAYTELVEKYNALKSDYNDLNSDYKNLKTDMQYALFPLEVTTGTISIDYYSAWVEAGKPRPSLD